MAGLAVGLLDHLFARALHQATAPTLAPHAHLGMLGAFLASLRNRVPNRDHLPKSDAKEWKAAVTATMGRPANSSGSQL